MPDNTKLTMNTVSLRILLITFALTLGLRAAEPQASLPLYYALESRTAQTNNSKVGYSEITLSCSGDTYAQRIYKKKRTGSQDSGDYSAPNLIYTSHYRYERIENAVTDEAWESTESDYSWVNPIEEIGESGSYMETNYYIGGSLVYSDWEGSPSPDFDYCAGLTPTTLENTTPTNASVITMCEAHSQDSDVVYSNYWWRIVYDEFTTEELLAVAFPDYSEWSLGGGGAYASIADDATRAVRDYSASLCKAEYRLKVLHTAGEPFTVPYVVHRESEDGSYYTNWTETLGGVGTGTTNYYDLKELFPEVIYVTNQFGCDDAVGIRQWISLACDGGPGCLAGSCLMEPGGFGAANSSLSIFASLGQGGFGKTSAYLLLYRGEAADTNITSASSLVLMGNSAGLEVIRTNGKLRQVLSEQVLADVIEMSSTELEITFYLKNSVSLENGVGPLYDVSSGSVVSSGIIEQNGSTNDIVLTVEKNGVTQVYDFAWDNGNNGWTLVSGGGLRKEVRAQSESPLVRTHTILNSGNDVVLEEVERYLTLTNGANVIVAREVGAPGSARTNRWVYYDDPQNDGNSYGRLKYVIAPGGFWTYYEYDSSGTKITKEKSQFLDGATNAVDTACRVVEYDYTSINGAKTERRIEKLLGQEISRSYTLDYGSDVYYIECQTPGAAWNASDNLVTRTTYGTGGEVWRTVNPDGTIQLSTTETNSSYMTRVTVSGKPGNQYMTNVIAGTSNVVVTPAPGLYYYGYSERYDIKSGLQIAGEYRSYYATATGLGQLSQITYLDGSHEYFSYDCCGLDSVYGRDGVTTYYLQDALKRQVGTQRDSITQTNQLDAAGNILRTVRVGGDSSVMTLRSMGYDTAGRLVCETNALDGVTTYSEAFDGSGQTVRTTVYPDLGTRVETYYQDGSLKSVTGTATFPVYFEYGVESEGGVQRSYTKETKGTPSGNEWIKTYTDMLGRAYKTVYAGSGAPASVSYYNDHGQLEKQLDPDGITTLYLYNEEGELVTTAIDMDGTAGLSSGDRVTHTESDVYELQSGDLWYGYMSYDFIRRTRTWQTNDSQAGVLVSEHWASVDGTRTANLVFGLTNQTERSFLPHWQKVIAPDGTYTYTSYLSGRPSSVTRYANDGYTQLASTSYTYDTYGRQYTITDLRSGTTTYTYNDADQIETVTTPDPDGAGGPASAQVTTTYYDTSLRATNVVNPDSTSTYTSYYPNGLLKKTWGSRIYPVEYTYDSAGRMKTMKTWQDFSGNTGMATTTWNYDAYRGWLASKRYNDGKGPDYTYTAAGRLDSRTWARGIETDYDYNSAGDLVSVDYSDSTLDVGYGYDRRGRQTTVTNGGSLWITRTYNDAGKLLTESYPAGPLSGLSVSNSYDNLLRRTGVALLSGSTELHSADYSYDANSGRLATVSDGTNSATYRYVDYSSLVDEIVFKENSNTRMTTTKDYDKLNRLTSISSKTNSVAVASFDYAYNNANQRTSVTNADGSYWVYTYDDLGQVTSGKKYWSDDTAVAGQQFDYQFDDIGNRDWTKAGQDVSSGQPHTANYWNNTLNQITHREVPGFAGVSGTATNTATVTVNLTATDRHGDYWWGEAPATNTNTPVWLGVTNIGVLQDSGNPDIIATNIGHVRVAKAAEAFAYDWDGNLVSDSLWTNTWNGENRRTMVWSSAQLPAAGRAREQWTYLPDGRWIERIVSTNNGSTYNPAFTNLYVWDGQVLLAVLDEAGTVQQAYTRGLDLSGTQQGAGGVGGLLWVSAGTNGTHFACFDGNGNVMALVDASSGEESARYEYGPFSEDIRATGPMARINSLRFSTQYADDMTGDRKYEHRDLDAITGRWLSRDPIGERGGLNLYGFVRNAATSTVDMDGRLPPEGPGPVIPPPPATEEPPYEPEPNAPPIPNPATDQWRICCQPAKDYPMFKHCDLRWYPCDYDISDEFPVTRDTKCCNKSIKTDLDMKKCFAKQPQGAGNDPFFNCQADAFYALQRCCGKTSWQPSMYIIVHDPSKIPNVCKAPKI